MIRDHDMSIYFQLLTLTEQRGWFFGTPSLSPPRQDNIQWNWPTVNPKARSSPQITHLQSFCTTARSNQQPRCQWPRRGWLSKWSCCRGCPSRWQSRSSREDFDWHLPLCSSAWYCPASNPHLIWRKEKGAGSPSTLEILRNTFEIENSYCISYDQPSEPSELRFHSIFKKKFFNPTKPRGWFCASRYLDPKQGNNGSVDHEAKKQPAEWVFFFEKKGELKSLGWGCWQIGTIEVSSAVEHKSGW